MPDKKTGPFWLIRVRGREERKVRLFASPGKTGGEAEQILKRFLRANPIVKGTPRKYRVGDRVKVRDLPPDGELTFPGGGSVFYLGYEQ